MNSNTTSTRGTSGTREHARRSGRRASAPRAAGPKRARYALATMLAALAAAGCAVGPDYSAPETAPPTFVHAEPAGLETAPYEARWWAQFGDPVLDDLVARALARDLDLRIAAARVAESRALLGVARRERWPSAPAEGAYERSKTQQPVFGDERIEVDSYEIGIATAWELDVFGRVRRGVEAAAAEAGAAEARLRDAEVLVAAEVARTYLELRGAEKRVEVARSNLENQRETVRLTRVRFELGRGSELDVASAEARLAAIEARIPPFVTEAKAARHRLAVLVGERPGALDAELGRAEVPPHLTTLAVGEPEALLRRRPDVRTAERELAAATAHVGVATAELFPRVSLSGFIGFVAGDADALGDSASRAWRTAPTLSWAAFDRGAVRARLGAAEARAEGALAAYERTVLQTLEETENAFVTYGQNRRRLLAAVDEAEASRRAAELARIQYREGALEFLRLLDAERTVLDAEDAVAAAETDLNTSVVEIYRALGGGWDSPRGSTEQEDS